MFKFLQKPLVFFRSIWIAVGVFLKSSKYPQEFQFYINKIFLKKHYKKSSRLGFFQHLKYMFKFIIVLIKTFRLLAINTDKLKYLGEKFIYKLEEKKLHAQKQAKNQDDASIKELQEIQNKNEQIHKLSYHVKNGNIEFLANAHVSRNAKISFVGSTLFRGNEADHNLPAVFDSLIKNTSNLDDIEILIAIDIDDDISYYVNIKRKYCKQIKNIRIFISPQKYGYIKLHLYDKCLYPKISPSSKMIADFSDDFQIVMKNWDRYVLQIDKKYKDNIYFMLY
ncbi:MAG: hypothetical protein HRT87_05770 [Legionellales bacterium]|nr:hypothetical protein [Legionellales bacterium]